MTNNMPFHEMPTSTCFVYDKRTGKVVHIHQFIADDPNGTCSTEEMEKMALNLAPSDYDRAHLGVLQSEESDQQLSPEFRYRVDSNTQKLIREPAPLTLQENMAQGQNTLANIVAFSAIMIVLFTIILERKSRSL